MKKYKNKYRIESPRRPNWDYRWNGAYFITINAKNRQHLFGQIKDEQMHLNNIGELAYKFWAEIPEHFPTVTLGEYIIMPNHVHGIIIINGQFPPGSIIPDPPNPETPSNPNDPSIPDNPSNPNALTIPDNPSNPNTSTIPENSLQCNESTGIVPDIVPDIGPDIGPDIKPKKPSIYPKPGSISTIIRSYKSVVTKNARYTNPNFGWQSRFHDRIIRDKNAYEQISNYIINNPKKWKEY